LKEFGPEFPEVSIRRGMYPAELTNCLQRGRNKSQQRIRGYRRRALWTREKLRPLRPINDNALPHSEVHESSEISQSLHYGPPPDSAEISNPIANDIHRLLRHPRSLGDRYYPETRQFAFELLRICGSKAIEIVQRNAPFHSRQTLIASPLGGYRRSDLADSKLVSDRMYSWCRMISNKLKSSQSCHRCVIACDALSFKLNVQVISEQIVGLDLKVFFRIAKIIYTFMAFQSSSGMENGFIKRNILRAMSSGNQWLAHNQSK
jgi:hypothetical protein